MLRCAFAAVGRSVGTNSIVCMQCGQVWPEAPIPRTPGSTLPAYLDWRIHHTNLELTIRCCYNRCIKLFFGFSKFHSVTNMLLELGFFSFDTVLCNSKSLFLNRLCNCANGIIQYLLQLKLYDVQ